MAVVFWKGVVMVRYAPLVIDFEAAEAAAKGNLVGIRLGGRAAVVESADSGRARVRRGSRGSVRSAGESELFFEINDALFEALGVGQRRVAARCGLAEVSERLSEAQRRATAAGLGLGLGERNSDKLTACRHSHHCATHIVGTWAVHHHILPIGGNRRQRRFFGRACDVAAQRGQPGGHWWPRARLDDRHH